MENRTRFCFSLPLLAASLYFLGTITAVLGYAGARATPRNMGEIFIGRCEEYQNVIRPDIFPSGSKKNCTDLWEKFRKAFAGKGPCNVAVESYNEFVAAASHKVDTEDKVMYWSGPVYPMVVEYAKLKSNKYTTIREILAAYVIRNIEDWCGQVASPGMDYNICPPWGNCSLLATTSFWTALSKSFAKQVRGTVHVMLNGSTGYAYNNQSIFAQSELKNLDPSRTPTMHVHLAYSVNGPIRENCRNGTLVGLRHDVEKKGMKFTCTDDDLDLLLFQCVTNMNAARCRTVTVRSRATETNSQGLALILPFILLLLAVEFPSLLADFNRL